jgi:hypothetical protein
VPHDLYSSDEEAEEEANKDRRITRTLFNVEKMSDKRKVPENELSDSEDEGDNRRDRQSYKERSLMSYDKERQVEDEEMQDASGTDEADDEADDADVLDA